MELSGFPMPKDFSTFPDSESFLQYLESFADQFDLRKYIKQQVTKVQRDGDVWKVEWRNAFCGDLTEREFDAVLVCTGHYRYPRKPYLSGEEKFTGKIIHSHDYRKPDVYRNQCVLVIGAGPSGSDIASHLTASCHRVLLSHHLPKQISTPFPSNLIQMPDVQKFTAEGAVFTDGRFEKLDAVIYCTGYEYKFPFLEESCELSSLGSHVSPLYRHLVNARHPTMCMLGLPMRVCIVMLIDAQARYVARLLAGGFQLPSREARLLWVRQQEDERKRRGLPAKATHVLDDTEDQYYGELALESGTTRVPPVMARIRAADTAHKRHNLLTYRHYTYTVLDDERFEEAYVPPDCTVGNS